MTAADPTLDGLLAGILEHPGEDDRRLIYADRCEELGLYERAEFVRAQVELASPRPWSKGHTVCHHEKPQDFCCCSCDGCVFRVRTRDLLAADGPPILGARTRWVNGVAETQAYRWMPLGAIEADWCDFRRGFVERITLSAESWLRHADGLTRAAPIREVVLTTPMVVKMLYASRTRVDYQLIGGRGRFTGTPLVMRHCAAGELPDYTTPMLLAAEWPRIKFTLPEPDSGSGSSGTITVEGQTHPFGEWTLMTGNPQAQQPRGVIDIPEDAPAAAPTSRRCPGCWREHDDGRRSLCRSCRQEQRRRTRGGRR